MASNILGGPFNGFSAKQVVNGTRDAGDVIARREFRLSWNNVGINGSVNGRNRVITPFRSVNSVGDYLNRQYYSCGGSSQINSRPGLNGLVRGSIPKTCDASGVAGFSGNPKFVSDCSDYIKFKRRSAMVKNYNDVKSGGDEHNSTYSAVMGVRRF